MDREDSARPGDESAAQQTSQTADMLRAMRIDETLPVDGEPASNPEAPKPSGSAWEDSPWSFLSGEASPAQSTGTPTELPAATPGLSNEVLSEADREALEKEQREQAYYEYKESLTESGLRVRIDKAAIAALINTLPIEELTGKIYARNAEDHERQLAERRHDLEATIEAIAGLPENLEFKPGITLIVGENGLGKSTLAKALRYATIIANRTMRWGDPEQAKEQVLNPRGVEDAKVELNDSGMAPEIVEHIQIDYFGDGSGLEPFYYDAAEIIGRQKTLNRQAGRTDYRYDEFGSSRKSEGQYSRDGRSHRQTVDDQLFGHLKREKQLEIRERDREPIRQDGKKTFHDLDKSGPRVYFIDEPETGMSPKRHKHLAEEVLDVTHEGATIILPTNSTVLYDSDLPRIDLEHPERGIFRPSEYPEDFE
jgi:energy-coupling factor transporter ATP-binding protein EcfA2